MATIVTTIRFPQSLKERLEDLAKEDNRSFNNLVITILQDAVKEVDEAEGKERGRYVE